MYDEVLKVFARKGIADDPAVSGDYLNEEGLEKSRKSTEAFQLKEKLGFADGEIVRLKAKLFDLMHPDF